MPKGTNGLSALNIVRRVGYTQVKKVVDAKHDIRIDVTKGDANHSSVRNHKECAMAVACKRKMNADAMIVSVSTAYVIKGKLATRYKVPPSVSREIVAFDRDGYFEPGTYALKAPSEYQKLGYRTGGEKTTKGAGSAHKFRHHTGGIRTSLLNV